MVPDGNAIALLPPMEDQRMPAQVRDSSAIMLITVPPELAVAYVGIPV
jgi:hypothetical protein